MNPPNDTGPGVRRLLIPIDLSRCSLDTFSVANGLVASCGGAATLLYVLPARAARPIGLERTLAGHHLSSLGRRYLRAGVSSHPRVRVGPPHQEIIEEAAASASELILLPVPARAAWGRLFRRPYGRTALGVIASAPCRVFVVEVHRFFNCLRDSLLWGPACAST